MKNFKNLFLTTSLILISLFSFAQEQETVTFVSSKSLNGASEVMLNLYGTVQTQAWDKDYIRIVMEIKTNGTTKEVIKHLSSKNRFRIACNLTDYNTVTLINPNILLPVYINGKKLEEDITYTVFIPQNTTVYTAPEKVNANSIAAINN